ncbi:thiamine-phosphate kinase [Pelagibacteraceae bacterium]|nr:thiamine-phosphate kinase [Pelagibacteraceae bacterium]
MIKTEIDIINKFKSLTFNNKKSLYLKDDVYYDSKLKLTYSTDTFEEDIHFLNSVDPKRFVKKIFRSSISDILCKGSIPIVYFVSLSVKKISNKWISTFQKELLKESKKFSVYLGGGDTVKSKKLSITISFIGYAKKKPILRTGAKIKDDIYITGDLGDSYLGLKIIKNKLNLGKYNNFFKKAYEEPLIPNKFLKLLSKFATSSIDISDGFVKDLKTLCSVSKCGALVNFQDIPFSKQVRISASKNKIKLNEIFSQGDDFQTLFTAKPKYRNLIKSISKKTKVKISRVGVITSKKYVKIVDAGKNLSIPASKSGYIHKF